ncbi:sensor histidine kinase [Maribacter sp. ACAM166]|uniref:sensor histidine kinase n=1 Tax=Maribacter sp. ACAM166 TaxID=2508996 RepID=UPI0010FD776C|nr:HAMP domain-containing sensor histidine kinase [Maribacter sp. ACAM166]TLP82335.1 HAMP domain-containing histidine kinase [Maribacter sp. ACAM166]
MTSIEAKLKERIKELTCLYEVTSIIVNSDYSQLETSLEAVTFCLKKAWQFEVDTEVLLKTGDYHIETEGYLSEMIFMKSDIRVFNQSSGFIQVGYPKDKYEQSSFLEEEKQLLQNAALAVGNLLERKQVHDSEAAIKRQVERTDRLHILGEITAGIAHEINTPLANILGFTELLKERVTDPDALRDLNKIVDNAIFSSEVVKKLMFFACEMPQQMKVVQVIPLVENVLKLLGPSLLTKSIKLTKSFSDDTIELRADNVQLTQVLFNLIMNAIYFSSKGGGIHIDIHKNEKNIQFRISDEGLGIDPKNDDKVFEPFFTTKPLGEGSGLGLSVVHGIINSHKGTITHSVNNPKGTVFTIDFPKL